ncbi:MAG: hypothetical protein ABJN36_15555 [Cyclobacteriaceae bacterium]
MIFRPPILLLGALLLLTAIHSPAQETLSDKVKHMHHHAKSKVKQPAYEFLSTWNTSADQIKPAQHELKHKIKQNKHKGKDPKKGTEKLQAAYDDAVRADGTERSFIAQTFAIPMLHELKTKGTALAAEDIYAAQYVIKYTLGMPRFNHGELDIDNLDQLEKELAALVAQYPDNDAHNQEIDGHVIDIFREEAGAFFQSFVAANQKELQKESGKSGSYASNLTDMNCGEKYEYLKEKGIMH